MYLHCIYIIKKEQVSSQKPHPKGGISETSYLMK